MIKLIFMLKRKDGLSRAQFRAMYEESHVGMAREAVGHLLQSYERNYIQEVGAPPTETDAKTEPFSWDVITEMRLKDQADLDEMNRIFGSPEIAPRFVADELRLFDRKYILMLRCDEVNTGTML